MVERAAGLEVRGPDLREGVVLLSPAELREIEQHAGLLDLGGLILPPHPAQRVGAVEDEAAHRSGCRAAYSMAIGPPWQVATSANCRKPAASTTHSKSRTQVSNDRSPASRSESPQPRES